MRENEGVKEINRKCKIGYFGKFEGIIWENQEK